MSPTTLSTARLLLCLTRSTPRLASSSVLHLHPRAQRKLPNLCGGALLSPVIAKVSTSTSSQHTASPYLYPRAHSRLHPSQTSLILKRHASSDNSANAAVAQTTSSSPPTQSNTVSERPPPSPSQTSPPHSESTESDITTPSALQQASGRELVLSPPALVVTREYEWANIFIGFEQANRYTIRAAPGGEVVGYLAEESNLGSAITRNVMRTRRPFKATVFDKEGNTIFTMRRPLFLISSSVLVETPDSQPLGEVQMNWHLWRRRYDLYVDKNQFASVDSGFLAVDFDMRDVDGQKVASVNKDFTGFAREIFTDARQYVLRLDPAFGLQSDGVLVSDAATVDTPAETLSEVRLGERERAIVLAAAIAIDFDYFSLHSRGHVNPGLMMMPGSGGGVGAPGGMGGAGAGAAVGADILSDAAVDVSEGEGMGASTSSAGATGTSSMHDEQNVPTSEDGSEAGTPSGDGGDSEWATFEEPDYGFTADPSSEDGDGDDWGDSDDGADSGWSWGGSDDGGGDGGLVDGGGGGADGGGGFMSILSDIFGGGGD